MERGIGVSTESDDIGMMILLLLNLYSKRMYPSCGNAHGKSSYANLTGKPSGKKVIVHTLFTLGGNEIDVVVPVDSILAISERFANTAYSFFLGNSMDELDAMLVNGLWYVRFAKFDELRADVELKDHIVVVMPKITREGHYTCNVHIEYEWKPPRCSLCKVFGHIHEEYLKNTGAGENKNVKKPSQTSRVRSDMHFGIDVDDEVLHKAVTVVKESTFVDQVVKFVVDIEEDCTKNDGCLCKIVCDDS
ncbi:hypothetical protein Tco_0780459 [Tanacetum coccineum]